MLRQGQTWSGHDAAGGGDGWNRVNPREEIQKSTSEAKFIGIKGLFLKAVLG